MTKAEVMQICSGAPEMTKNENTDSESGRWGRVPATMTSTSTSAASQHIAFRKVNERASAYHVVYNVELNVLESTVYDQFV